MTKKISVIIPVYNREQYIEECVASLQSQSYGTLEILLIDDGSTDCTLAICKKLAEKDSRIVLLQGSHGGVSAARNKGLDTATGDYVFFLDSDDVIHPLLLETLLTQMQKTGAPISGSPICRVSQRNWEQVVSIIAADGGPGQTEHRSYDQAIGDFFSYTTPINLVGGVMIRKDWIGQTRFRTDLYIGEDYFFVYENLIKGAEAIFLQQKWYYSRLHQTNSSWDFQLSGFLNRLYRRELVWKSEEALGRQKNADFIKREAFSIFMSFRKKPHIRYRDRKQMRKKMRACRKEILPALSTKRKLAFMAVNYFPVFFPVIKRRKK